MIEGQLEKYVFLDIFTVNNKFLGFFGVIVLKSENGTRSDSNPWLNEKNVLECDWIINLESRFWLICFNEEENRIFEVMYAKAKMAQNLIESWIGRIDSVESD